MEFDLNARERAIASDLIVSLPLSERTVSLLARSGYTRLTQLAEVDPEQLLQSCGFDRAALAELGDALFVRGLRLADGEELSRPRMGRGPDAERSLGEERRTVEAQGLLR